MALRPWTKTHSPSDLQGQQKEAKQKVLDKIKQKVYNTLVVQEGKDPSVFSFDAPPKDFSKNKAMSDEVFGNIRRYLDVANEACLKEGYAHPIISGGCIRDAMYGVRPKDYDIFVDVTGVEDEDLSADDRFHLLVDRMLPEADGWKYTREDKVQYHRMDNHFIVYTCRQEVANPASPVIQVIGRHDKTISSENPLDFTNDFPYNIIKNVAFEDRMAIHPQAMFGFKEKTVQAFDGGYDKAYSWFARHAPRLTFEEFAGTAPKPKNSWKILRSPADQKKYDESKTKAQSTLTRSIFPVLRTRDVQLDEFARIWDNPPPILPFRAGWREPAPEAGPVEAVAAQIAAAMDRNILNRVDQEFMAGDQWDRPRADDDPF